MRFAYCTLHMLHMPKAPALHRRPLVNAAEIERQITPERLSPGLIDDIDHNEAADELLAVVVEQRPPTYGVRS